MVLHRSFACGAPRVLVLLALLGPTSAQGVQRDAYHEIRGRYEGMSLRLRVDLMQVTGARPPNVVSLDGIGHGRERARVLFGRLETVYIERVTNEGGSRIGLTVYRTQQEADRFRASNVPQPSFANPNYGRTLASFAQLGSTSVDLELKAPKNQPDAQMREVEALVGRIFYVDAQPTREEVEDFVRQHPGLPVDRLRELTGLEGARVREILREAAGPPPPPKAPAEPAPTPEASPAPAS